MTTYLETANLNASRREPIFKIGTRVRVNEQFPYTPSRGLVGTVIGISWHWPHTRWIEVDFDDKSEIKVPVKWHRSYFDLAGGGESQADR